MRRALTLILLCATPLLAAPAASAGGGESHGPPSVADRVEELQQELDSLTEEIEDLQEPVAEFELFDECMYLIGVTPYGGRSGEFGYRYGSGHRRALSLDIGGFGRPRFHFLAFPGEEPPSIECNEDAGEEDSDD
jgi:hypothetical protein